MCGLEERAPLRWGGGGGRGDSNGNLWEGGRQLHYGGGGLHWRDGGAPLGS